MKSFVAASALATMAMLPDFGASQSTGTDFAPKMKAYLAKAAKGDHHNDDVNPVGRAVLSYLGECAGADLQPNTCIASAFVNITFADGPDGEPTRRFLESEDGEDCDPPTTNEVRQVVREAKDRCPASSRSESKTFLQSMITIVKDDACMTSICDEEVMGRIVFGVFLREQLLPCSGFDHTLDGCVVDQVADQFVNSSNDTWSPMPTNDTTIFGDFTSHFLGSLFSATGALATECDLSKKKLGMAAYALVKMVSAPLECWGMDWFEEF